MENKFGQFLDLLGIKIIKYRPERQRPLTTNIGTMNIAKFRKILQERIGPRAREYADISVDLMDETNTTILVEKYCRENNLKEDSQSRPELPKHMEDLTLNIDVSHPGREIKYFLTTPEEYVSMISGSVYLASIHAKEMDAVAAARHVIPEYLPRSKRGIVGKTMVSGEKLNIFNSYIPSPWMLYKKPTPDKLPPLFIKLVKHLFPLEIEREYFYHWLYHSLFDRALVYLVLCGAPGAGKNTLKLVIRALHGMQNTVDGKKSTLVDRFNSQLADATLAWFDELHYTPEMENVMKELQNDTISIEKKNIDATRSTKIFASLVISNNKPRDNFIAFDARKFAPLFVTSKRLETSMSSDEIDSLVKKVRDPSHPEYDVWFLAQIGRWIQKRGKSKKWPNLEYKGPVFYKLAHTSMTRWQKRAVVTLLEAQPGAMTRMQYDKNKGYLWSTVEAFIVKGRGEKGMTFPDFSSVRHFFEIFLDGVGKKSFTTEVVQGNIMGDFWVKIINKNTKILTESDVLKDLGVEDGQEEDEEDYSYL